LLCLALVLGAAGAVAAPTDVAGFTALLADKFADANPDAKVEVKGPLELEITIGKGPHQTLLRNVWGLCQRVPERCDLAIDDFVGHYSGAMREEDGPVTRADLRAVVRTEGYVEELRQVAANKPDAAVIARKLAGDLWLICVVDRADGVELLNMGTIAKLHLSADDAISTALDNVEQSLPPMAKQKTKLLRGKVTVISGDFYNSSRILLAADCEADARRPDCGRARDGLAGLWEVRDG
jgi:hypothetical protein